MKLSLSHPEHPLCALSLSVAIGLSVMLSMPAHATKSAMAVAQGMGDTVRANPWDPMTAYAAPGMVWIDGRFEVGGSGQYSSADTNVWQVGAYDAQTSKVGFGLFWSRDSRSVVPKNEELPGWREVDEEFDNHITSSVLAMTIGGGGIHNLFGAGLGVRYFYRSTKLGGVEHAVTLSPSVATVVQEELYLTLTAENVIPTNQPDSPVAIGTGTRWQPSNRFAIAFDSLTDFTSVSGEVRFTPMVGAEVRIANVVPIRAGWTRNGVDDSQWVTGGIGVENESVGLSYSLQMDAWSDEDVLVHQHGLMLRVSM